MTRDERMAVIERAKKATDQLRLQGGAWPTMIFHLEDRIRELVGALEDAQADLDKWPSVPPINGKNPWELVGRAERALSCGPYAVHSRLAMELLSGFKEALYRIEFEIQNVALAKLEAGRYLESLKGTAWVGIDLAAGPEPKPATAEGGEG